MGSAECPPHDISHTPEILDDPTKKQLPGKKLLLSDGSGLTESSGKDFHDRLSFVGQGKRTLAGGINDLVKRHAQSITDGGVDVGDLHFVFRHFASFLIGFSVDEAALDAAT